MDAHAPEITALVDRLRAEHGSDVGLAAPPTTDDEGFDSAIHLLELTDASLPPAWRRPLVVRVKADPERADEALREREIHRWLVARDYPAPEILAVFRPGELTDLPVQVMARAPGILLADAFLRRPWTARRLLRRLARLQAELHASRSTASRRETTSSIAGCGWRGSPPTASTTSPSAPAWRASTPWLTGCAPARWRCATATSTRSTSSATTPRPRSSTGPTPASSTAATRVTPLTTGRRASPPAWSTSCAAASTRPRPPYPPVPAEIPAPGPLTSYRR